MVLRIGRDFGMRAIRVPRESAAPCAGRAGGEARALPSTRRPGRRAAAPPGPAGRLLTPDGVLGLAWSGAMTPARVEGLLRHLPDGLTELYLHPATAGGFPGEAPGYAYAEELAP